MTLAELARKEEAKRAAALSPEQRARDAQEGLAWAAEQATAPKHDPASRIAEERRKLEEWARRHGPFHSFVP